MSNAIHDQNFVPIKLGVLCTDGVTLIPIAVNSSGGGMKTDVVSSISYNPTGIDFRDENYRPAWMGVDSVTGLACPIFVNASGEVLIDN